MVADLSDFANQPLHASASGKDNRSHTAQLVRWTNQLVENAAGSTGRKILRTVGIPPTPRATPQESIYSTPTKGEKPKSVSDERLRTMLSKHCRESRKPAHRVNSTMLVLDGSIRQIHAKDKELRGMISYDYLAHRVRPQPNTAIGEQGVLVSTKLFEFVRIAEPSCPCLPPSAATAARLAE